MTNQDATKVGSIETELSLAIELIDHVTGGSPIRFPTVRLAERPEQFTRTTDDYYVVADIPESVESVTVIIDESPMYLSARLSVDLTDIDPSTPESITLVPAPGYPLGRRATAVRGSVVDETERPVSEAVVTIQHRDERTRSNTQGEFLLPIVHIDSADVVDGTLQVDGATPTLEATHPTSTTVITKTSQISIGETVRQDIQF